MLLSSLLVLMFGCIQYLCVSVQFFLLLQQVILLVMVCGMGIVMKGKGFVKMVLCSYYLYWMCRCRILIWVLSILQYNGNVMFELEFLMVKKKVIEVLIVFGEDFVEKRCFVWFLIIRQVLCFVFFLKFFVVSFFIVCVCCCFEGLGI